MAGIYIHIPFCRQACSYCNFHFSTTLDLKEQMLAALHRELELCAPDWQEEPVETIYFGGGTPSLYAPEIIQGLIDKVRALYPVADGPEITLECNPDDVQSEWLKALSRTEVNRLSLGVQSFDEEVLRFMHRAHNAEQSVRSLELLAEYPALQLSTDLIYGLPGQDVGAWLAQLQRMWAYQPDHLSCYQLTVEPTTALAHMVKQGKTIMPPDERVVEQFDALMDFAAEVGLEHYEISNFCQPGKYARHNTAYWQGRPYLGIGPSAHSYRENQRWWNVANNPKYLAAIEDDQLSGEEETLSPADVYNEYVMTGLRTIWGVQLEKIRTMGEGFAEHFLREVEQYLERDYVEIKEPGIYTLTRAGRHVADGVAAGMFWVE